MGGVTQSPPIGVNQTWQDVSGSRTSGVTYTNTTGRPILVNVALYQNGISQSGGNLKVNGIIVGQTVNQTAGLNIGNASTISAIVPINGTYLVTVSGVINYWAELK